MRYPKDLKADVELFKGITVKHDLQEAALDLVLFLLEVSPNVNIVNLVGPTGIGKTQLQLRVLDAMIEVNRIEMEQDPQFMPIIRTSAIAAGYRLFDWKTLYVDALAAVGDPFAGGRIKRQSGQADEDLKAFKGAGESLTAAVLRMRLQEEFRRRRTRVWIIDEAQHLAFGGRSGQPGDQFDVLKSIADSASVKLMLAGPHEMEPALGSSGQLSRRSSTVHFRRYQASDPQHMRTFASIASTLLSRMKIAGYPSIQESRGFLYSGSAGCVGILKDWLARAYGRALRERKDGLPPLLTLDHLRETRLSLKSMATIMEDIRRAEEASLDQASDSDFEQLVLGASPKDASPSRPKPARGTGRPVGVRSPARDPVPTGAANGDCAEEGEQK